MEIPLKSQGVFAIAQNPFGEQVCLMFEGFFGGKLEHHISH